MASGSWDVTPVPPAPPASPAMNRPDNTAFTQQRLPAWQPLLSAGTVLPLFLGLGLAFLAMGLGLHFSSEGIQELELDYTGTPGTPCANCSLRATSCNCTLHFHVPRALPAPTCFYYQLSGYYQNNRRYSVSRDDQQLSGSAWALLHPADECKPFQRLSNGTPVAPCGAVANSLFNDTFELHRLHPNGSRVSVLLDQRGISWWTDTNLKFRNPQPVDGSLAAAFAGTARPPNWRVPAYNLDTTDPNNTGFVNEHFVVWMRIAALPTFRKLYARLRPQGNSSEALPPGNYSLTVTYNYPVLSFNGTKKVILSTVSWMGGKNPFLGIAYLVLGSACILTGCLMLVVHLKYREQGE